MGVVRCLVHRPNLSLHHLGKIYAGHGWVLFVVILVLKLTSWSYGTGQDHCAHAGSTHAINI
jgi:hypothetical protein